MPFFLYLSQRGESVTHTNDELYRYSDFALSDYGGGKLARE